MIPLVLVGPSGAGKSTLVKYLQGKAADSFAFSVSSTTRKPRDGEVNGVHYHFVSKDEFLADVAAGMFLEHQEVHGNFYGTHRKQVEDAQNQGKICILDIDVKGALEVSQGGKIDCNYVFINTPSLDELKRRLQARSTETEETLAKRIGNAEAEIKLARKHQEIFTKYIINDDQDSFIREACTYLTNSNMYPQLNI